MALTNIGGLDDLSLQIPAGPLVALAGTNGTGKSRFLASLLVPWTQAMPTPRDPSAVASIDLSIEFDESELDALQKFDGGAGWNQGRPPQHVVLHYKQVPLVGLNLTSEPSLLSITQCFTNSQLLGAHPSLNLV